MLGGFRVLDLTDEKGYLCGKILGDMGADVIKIEKPGGDSGRRIGPFYHDIADPEKSLYWFAYNSNKKGITLNIESSAGKEILKKLVESGDCLIESFPVGYLDSLGLGYSELSKLNPRLIMTSITPFGQKGPYKDYQASDLTLQALGGIIYITGDSDRPPVRVGHSQSLQSFQNGAADAAVATMIAYYYREISGEGQYIDVSIQQSMFLNSVFYTIAFWEFDGVITGRYGPFRSGLGTGAVTRMIWACKDGFVNMTIMGGAVGAKRNRALVEWLDSEGMCPDFMKEINWETFDMWQMTQELWNKLEVPISRFFRSHTKAELYEGSVKRNIMIYPVYTPEDLLAYEQLRARQYWRSVKHPELNDSIVYPGAFAKSSEADFNIRQRPPRIGEHNQEIYIEELGYTTKELNILKQAGVT
jgi:crotonobetainyl-CoA:carnitine CoA-transferase CaiB-like acyl-CoA transferase